MGVYPNHGVEYWLVLRADVADQVVEGTPYAKGYYPEWKRVCLFPMSMTDARLQQSSYYQSRKHAWFGREEFRSEYLRPCEDPVDIQFTPQEQTILSQALTHLGEAVVSHGWCERNVLHLSM